MKKFAFFVLIVTMFTACEKEVICVDPFFSEPIYGWISRDSSLTEFKKVIDKAGLKGMLSAYGNYTCLAPVNSAFRAYYASKGARFTFDSLSQSQVDSIARTHILVKSFLTTEQKDGLLPMLNMDHRAIEIKFTSSSIDTRLMIMLNDSSEILDKDIRTENGVLHIVSKLIRPSNASLFDFVGKNPNLSIFYEALKLTHLCDSISKFNDETYHPTKVIKDIYNTYTIINPSERRFGYTLLAEDNTVLSASGINSLNDLIQKAKEIYPTSAAYDNEYTSRENSLNKYMSYHLINKLIFRDKFLFPRNAIRGYYPDEFLETMLQNKLIKTSFSNLGITLNGNSNNSVIVQMDGSKATVNGIYHLLNKMLAYTPDVENMFQKTRIRFDMACLFPELTNNDIRASEGRMTENDFLGDYFGFESGYLANLKMTEDTKMCYIAGTGSEWGSYQSDVFIGTGNFDITIRLLPVPPGTYELRLGYAANSNRSVAQLYIDGVPQGAPVDFRDQLIAPEIGYILDAQTDDNGYENDKNLRNKGYMKAPNTFYYGSTLVRDSPAHCRKIIGTFTFSNYQAHSIRLRSVLVGKDRQCPLDYFEFVPESIYSPANGLPESRE